MILDENLFESIRTERGQRRLNRYKRKEEDLDIDIDLDEEMLQEKGLRNNEIDDFFLKAKKLGVETLGDLKQLLDGTEPEAFTKTNKKRSEYQTMKSYYKNANPKDSDYTNEDVKLSKEDKEFLSRFEDIDEEENLSIMDRVARKEEKVQNVDDTEDFIDESFTEEEAERLNSIFNEAKEESKALDESLDDVHKLAKKHNVQIVFLDDEGDNFYADGDPQAVKAFYDDYVTLKNSQTESVEGDEIAQATIDSKNNNFEKDKETERQVKIELAKQGITEDLSQEEQTKSGLTTLINDLINDENEAINAYESAIVTIASENKDDFIPVIKDIISEEQKHIGQLQTLLAQLNPENMKNVEEGQKEGQEQLSQNSEDDAEDSEQEIEIIDVE